MSIWHAWLIGDIIILVTVDGDFYADIQRVPLVDASCSLDFCSGVGGDIRCYGFFCVVAP